MPPRIYSSAKLGTQPYNSVKVFGKNLVVGEIIWLPDSVPPTGVVRAYRLPPLRLRSKYSRAKVESTSLGGHGLLLSWV